MIAIIKTPVSQDADTYEFRVAYTIDGLFSNVSYRKKVENLKIIKRVVICDSMEEADLVVNGIKLVQPTEEVLKIKFPEPFDDLIKIKNDNPKNYGDYKDELNSMFGGIFGNIFK